MATSKITNSQDYIVHTQTIIDTDSTGSDYKNTSVAADSIPGYTPIGAAGWAEGSAGSIYYYVLYVKNNRIYYAWQTRNESIVKNHTFLVYVLYKKN